MIAKCRHCGAEFEKSGRGSGRSLYCGVECRRLASNARARMVPTAENCPECGAEFQSGGRMRKYCSNACLRAAGGRKANARRRAKRAAARAARPPAKPKPRAPKPERQCKRCQATFTPTHSRHFYCGAPCRLAVEAAREAAAAAERRAERWKLKAAAKAKTDTVAVLPAPKVSQARAERQPEPEPKPAPPFRIRKPAAKKAPALPPGLEGDALRAKLADDVAAFLKAGGRVRKVATGESAYA